MRRLIVEEPVSRAASWSPRLAWFALAVTLIAVLLVRFERVDPRTGLVVVSTGLALALAAAACAGLAFVMIWREGRRGLGSALGGLVLAALILAYPAFLAVRYVTLPRLTDISTDIEDPPVFSRSQAALAARGGTVPPPVPTEERARQRQAYGRIAPLTLDVAPDQAFDLVRKAADSRGWRVLDAVRPGGRVGTGRLDAVDRTLVMRFPDDVTVRLRPRADGTRIDVRSVSRIGHHDLGANAERIRRFLDEVSALAIALER